MSETIRAKRGQRLQALDELAALALVHARIPVVHDVVQQLGVTKPGLRSEVDCFDFLIIKPW